MSVTISNLALAKVGTSRFITSLTESSNEAAQCNLWYDESRKYVLEARDWSFARKRVEADEHDDDPPEVQWQYRYDYPSDCIVLRRIEHSNESFSQPFQVEVSEDGTKSVLTNQPEARLIYTFDQDTVAAFSPKFTDSLSWYLASRIAFALTAGRDVADYCMKAYEDSLRMGPDVAEGQEPTAPDAPWVTGR